jgi:hypothetical protein
MKKSLKQPGKTLSKITAKDDVKRALEAPLSEGKIRVTTYIDADVYLALNEEARQACEKYQTLLNKYLRAAVLREITPADIKRLQIALEKK